MIPRLAALLLAAPASANPIYGAAPAGTALTVYSDPALAVPLGEIPAGAGPIEIVSDGTSGRIVWEEGAGYVGLADTAPATPTSFAGTALPDGLTCAGTEPFWSLSLRTPGGVFAAPDNATVTLSLALAQTASGKPAFPTALSFGAESHQLLGVVRPLDCSDGMSDRTYPWTLDLVVQAGGRQGFLTGCCHLPLDRGQH